MVAQDSSDFSFTGWDEWADMGAEFGALPAAPPLSVSEPQGLHKTGTFAARYSASAVLRTLGRVFIADPAFRFAAPALPCGINPPRLRAGCGGCRSAKECVRRGG